MSIGLEWLAVVVVIWIAYRVGAVRERRRCLLERVYWYQHHEAKS